MNQMLDLLIKGSIKSPLRWPIAIVGTIQQNIKYLSPVLIYPDKEGDWHNHRRKATFVSPVLNVYSWSAVQAVVMDLWCYNYKLRSGDTIIDIGSGIGEDVLVFSRLVGKKGRVVAIEAHPRTYRCLLKTIMANRLDNVIAINAAISDRNGCITISEEKCFLSNSTRVGTGVVKVQARTLENVLRQTGSMRSDLIKMNIEGAETTALEGMKEILRTTTHIVVSCHDFKADRGESRVFRTHESVKRILLNSGFNLCRREEDSRPEVRYCLYGTKII